MKMFTFLDAKWGTELAFYDETEEGAREQYRETIGREAGRVIQRLPV
jgi:hypothetical protein